MHWNKENIPELQSDLANTTLMSMTPAVPVQEKLSGAKVFAFQPNRQSLLEALESDGSETVLLQYVGYGYDSNGVPDWLCTTLQEWRAGNANRRLFVMFHETWANGPPWKKAFWLSGKQKQCAAQLLRLSEASAVSNAVNARQLASLHQPTPVSTIPISTNFLLPNDALEPNPRRFVLMGQQGTRLRGIRWHLDLLRRLHAENLIDELLLAGQLSADVDPSHELLKTELPGLRVSGSYNFAFDGVPEEVLTAGVALMHTQTRFLLKSGSFHMALACGQVPVALLEGGMEPPFVLQRHVLAYKRGEGSSNRVVKYFTSEMISDIACKLHELTSHTSWASIVSKWHHVISESRS